MSLKVSGGGLLAGLVLLMAVSAPSVATSGYRYMSREFSHRPMAVESRYASHSGVSFHGSPHHYQPAPLEIRHTRIISPIPLPVMHASPVMSLLSPSNRSAAAATSAGSDSLANCPSRCTQAVWNELEAPLSGYIAGVESLTSSIQELDEAVQQMQPSQFSACDSLRATPSTQAPLAFSSSASPLSSPASSWAPTSEAPLTTTTMLASSTVEPLVVAKEMSVQDQAAASPSMLVESSSFSSTTSLPEESGLLGASSTSATSTVSEVSSERALEASTTPASLEPSSSAMPVSEASPVNPVDAGVSSFLDASDTDTVDLIAANRRRRDAEPSNELYGQPSTQMVNFTYRARDELSQVSMELEKLSKELGTTAEWLKQNNHTVHSVMMRALQVYVTSIERHIEHRRNADGKVAKIELLKSKIQKIKDKVAHLFEKLKSLLPHKHHQPGTVVTTAVREGSVVAGVGGAVDASARGAMPVVNGPASIRVVNVY